jgi:hypothetical protein
MAAANLHQRGWIDGWERLVAKGAPAMLKHQLRQIEALLQRMAQARRGAPALAPRPLQTPHDVIELLHEQVEAIRQDPCAGPLEKARAIGYLAGIAARAIETDTLAQRLEILEARLRARKGPRPS